MNSDIEVSVYCLAYNHGRYIAQALEGFVKQKTTFHYEVIVHDDASSDNTAKVIAEYASRYPDIIKPVYQRENQYSKGVSILDQFIEPILNSKKYYAICEGDDYWIDENKLQIQYDYMENHENCSMCVHNTKKIAEDGNDLHLVFNTSATDTEYSTEEIIKAGGGGLFHTSSFFWRKKYGLSVPDSFKIKGIGDYTRAIYLSTVGDIYYFGKVMSAYRIGSVNSWMKSTTGNTDKMTHHIELIVAGLERMNQYTERNYNEAFNLAIAQNKFRLCEIKRDYKNIFRDPVLLSVYKEKSLTQKLKIWLKMLLKR